MSTFYNKILKKVQESDVLKVHVSNGKPYIYCTRCACTLKVDGKHIKSQVTFIFSVINDNL